MALDGTFNCSGFGGIRHPGRGFAGAPAAASRDRILAVLRKLRELLVSLSVYGIGGVAVQLANVFLLPLYARLLSPTDYGVIGVLLVVEQVMRVSYRWGVDAAFMRFYYDCTDTRSRQALASTLFFFLGAVSGAVMLAGVWAAPWASRTLFGSVAWATPVRLVFGTTFLGCTTFLPLHVLRIEGKAGPFARLMFATNVGAVLSKLLLVAALGMGVAGVYWADFIVAVGLALVLLPRYASLIRPTFSPAVLRECLRFGLPRVPHGVAHQVLAGVDRYALSRYAPLKDVGIYSVGASIGQGLKLFLSAFETAWAPFYYSEMKQPDAKATFRTVTTYGIGALVLLAAGLAATATDIVRLLTTPRYYGAGAIVPWIGLSVMLQGLYLLTSIGLNISKRTVLYPVSTGLAAVTAISMNVVLIPRYGAIGAAWSSSIAYGVLALAGLAFSQSVYPIRHDWPRHLRLAVAGVVSVAAGFWVLPVSAWPLLGIVVRGSVVVAVYSGTLVLLGFFEPREVRQLKQLAGRAWSASRSRRPATVDADAPDGGSDA